LNGGSDGLNDAVSCRLVAVQNQISFHDAFKLKVSRVFNPDSRIVALPVISLSRPAYATLVVTTIDANRLAP
jgi:hypothetical protein